MQKTLQALQEKRKSKKGFTLMEMLIVVAIIAVLVAIAIPVFNTQLNNAKAQVDDANLRSATSMAVADYFSTSKSGDITYYGVYGGSATETGSSDKTLAVSTDKPEDKDYYASESSGHAGKHIVVILTDGGKVTSAKWDTVA